MTRDELRHVLADIDHPVDHRTLRTREARRTVEADTIQCRATQIAPPQAGPRCLGTRAHHPRRSHRVNSVFVRSTRQRTQSTS